MLGNSSAQWRRLDSMTQGRMGWSSWRITFRDDGSAVVEIPYPRENLLQIKYIVTSDGFLEKYPGFAGAGSEDWEPRC
jgi:hypothetical protein